VWPNALDLPTPKGDNLAWRVYRMARIPHQLHQYAGQYWLREALRNAGRGLLTDNIEEACLVWVDIYCYQQVRSLNSRRSQEDCHNSWNGNSLSERLHDSYWMDTSPPS
jgi:hypothetical protein